MRVYLSGCLATCLSASRLTGWLAGYLTGSRLRSNLRAYSRRKRKRISSIVTNELSCKSLLTTTLIVVHGRQRFQDHQEASFAAVVAGAVVSFCFVFVCKLQAVVIEEAFGVSFYSQNVESLRFDLRTTFIQLCSRSMVPMIHARKVKARTVRQFIGAVCANILFTVDPQSIVN